MIKKLFITHYFANTFPEWIDKYIENTKFLKKYGYDFLLDTDLNKFNQRCKKALGFESSILPGTVKIGDYRPAFGLIYEDILSGYDFWGHTDTDCVYGRLDHFLTSNLLENCDIFANDPG